MRSWPVELLTLLKTSVIYSIIIASDLKLVYSVENLAKRAVSTWPPVATVTPLFPNLTTAPIGNASRDITDNDPNTEVYATLIDTFEKLGLITPRLKTCYTIKKIIREVFSQKTGAKRTLGIYLYLDESLLETHPTLPVEGENDVNPSSSENSGEKLTNDSSSDKDSECKSSPVVVITGSDSLKDVNGTAMEEESVSVNSTGGLISAQAVDDDQSGLSHTQVMVISTCSAVIGTFFLVAAIMRIRNYVKRMREGRGSTTQPQRSQFRAFSGGLRSSPLRGGQTRTSSFTGSTSPERQFSSVRNSKDSVLYNRQHGDKSSDPLISVVTAGDDKPVLVITSASTSNSPSSSGRGSQEEVANNSRTKKVTESDSGEDEDVDYKNTECRPLLSNQKQMTSELQQVNMPYMDASPVSEEKLQGLERETVPVCVMDQNMPADLSLLPDSNGLENVNSVALNSQEAVVVGGLAGLCQSDSSLNSNPHPSYLYGNQEEYVDEIGSIDEELASWPDDDTTFLPSDIENCNEHPSYATRQPYFVPRMASFDTMNQYPNDNSSGYNDQRLIPVEELPPPAPELLREYSIDNSCDNTNDDSLMRNNASDSELLQDSLASNPVVSPNANNLPLDVNVLTNQGDPPQTNTQTLQNDNFPFKLVDERTSLL